MNWTIVCVKDAGNESTNLIGTRDKVFLKAKIMLAKSPQVRSIIVVAPDGSASRIQSPDVTERLVPAEDSTLKTGEKNAE